MCRHTWWHKMKIQNVTLFIAKCCAGIVLLSGLSVMLGWFTHSDLLIRVSNTFTPMQFNCALSFCLAGVGLLAAIFNKTKLLLTCSIIIGIIGGLTLIEYIFHLQLGLDDLFITPYFVVNKVYPGRMALVSSIGLIFISLLFLSINTANEQRKFFFTTVTASVILILGLVPLVGYISGIELAYSLGQTTHIAVHTAICFILLGIGANAYMRHVDQLKTHNMLATWCSILAGLVIFLLSLALWQQSLMKENKLLLDKIKFEANLIQHNIKEQIYSSVIALRRMAQRWAIRGGTPKSEWMDDTSNYLYDTKALSSIELIDTQYRRLWINRAAVKPFETALDRDFTLDQTKILKQGVRHKDIVLTAPIDFNQGKKGVVAYVPIFKNNHFYGFIAGVYNTQRLIDSFYSPGMKDLFTIQLIDDGKEVYSSIINYQIDPQKAYVVHFPLFNRSWELIVEPTAKFYSQQLSPLAHMELVGGSVFALLLCIAIYYAITASQRSEQITRLIATIDESPDFIGMADIQGHLLYHNNGAKRMVGLPLDYDLSHMQIKDMHPEWAFKILAEQVIPVVKKQGFWTGETALIHHVTHKEIPVLQTLTLHGNPNEKSSYLTTIMRDITELKKSELALKNSEETFRSSMENASIGMAMLSLKGHWLKVNPALCQIVGYTEEELLATNFLQMTHPEDMGLDIDDLSKLKAGEIKSYQLERRYIHKNGTLVWTAVNVSLVRDSEDKPVHYIVQIQNIDSRKRVENELKHIAYHDVLTGLANRKQLETSFDIALAYAKRHKTHLALLFLDLDGFKAINDNYGHEIGDILLVEVAARLRESVRATDIIVRLGGDEFIIVITELIDISLVSEMAHTIIRTVSKPIHIKEHELNITVSVGISLYPDDGSDLKVLIKYADKALYYVKAEGRNNFCLYSDINNAHI